MAAEATFSVPKWLFKNSDGSPCEIKNTLAAVSAGATNAQVLAAVTGKRLRVLSITVNAGTAASILLSLKNGSGGAGLLYLRDPSTSTGAQIHLAPSEIGHADTGEGVGLFADTAGADLVISVRYIEYS